MPPPTPWPDCIGNSPELCCITFMNKPGHALHSLDCPLLPEAMDTLRDQYSITTAEELASAAVHAGNALRERLAVSDEVWQETLKAARAVCSPELMTADKPQKFGKGAVFKRLEEVRPDLEKYLTRE